MPRKSAAASQSATDLMSDLLGAATTAPKTPAKGKKDKPVLQPANPDEERAIDDLTSSDAIVKVAQAVQGAAKLRVHQILKRKYLQLCAERGYKPENPTVSTTHSRANYIVKHINKFNMPQNADGSPADIGDLISQQGFSPDIVAAAKANIHEKVHLGLKKFTALTEGTQAEKDLATKLMTLVKANFQPAELAMLLEKSTEVKVDEGWQNKAIQLALESVPKGTPDREAKAAEALDKLYSVIQPMFVVSHMVYNAPLDAALKRLQQEEADQDKVEKTIDHTNGMYRARCKGPVVTLYLVKPNKEEEKLGEKKCTNPGHAEASAKKWFREPAALEEAMKEFAQS